MVQIIKLVIESSVNAEIWGRVHYDNNLIIESAPDLKILDRRMKKHLKDFHQLNLEDLHLIFNMILPEEAWFIHY